ncbi:MAG: hypothetical protein KDD61_12575, partial [Bdellovibrionales bacterium]|nr:hypothetical protein [Bdellovibrionales bacterium]
MQQTKKCTSYKRFSAGLRLLRVVLSLVVLEAGIAGALCVKENVANLRKGPGTKYSKTWTVGKYTPLEEVQRQGVWIKVLDVDEEEHWIHR